MNPDLQQKIEAALNRLTKWRTVFAGWQLGTRLKGDPESDALRDHRELTILLRCESSALVGLLLKKGVFTHDEWLEALRAEAEQLSQDYEQKFPGFKATDNGISIDPTIAAKTTKGWKP